MWADRMWLAVDVAVLLCGYALVDRAMRQGWVSRALARLGATRPDVQAAALFVPGLLACPFWSWTRVPEGDGVRVLAGVLCSALAWRAATRDIDVVIGERQMLARALLVLAALGSFWSPALLVSACLLLSGPFGMWQHHATLPMRCLQAAVAFTGLVPVARALATVPVLHGAAGLVHLLVVIQVSHYVITALAKGFLGPHWYSWPLDNQLHHIAASAYSWGWARFIPWERWRRVIELARRCERPLQLAVFALEALSPLALLSTPASLGLSFAFAGFHAGVFALSGLLFWEWIVTDLALAWLVSELSPATLTLAFGPLQLLLGLLVLIVFPLRHRLWKPMPLGWWDTPFTQRMHWRVRGDSGARYGLYADFMDPHERIYGKVHGCFFAPVPVLTYHLGEAFRHELRDGLRAAAGDPDRIELLRREFGVEPRDQRLADNHVAYLERFCWELNRGAQKHVLPRCMRFLKAPGGQCYYWGELPAYRLQEPIREVEVVYREEYFDGQALCRLRDEVVLRVAIGDGETAPEGAREPTPKELDDHLLAFAAGRLIRLPGVGGGYVRGDDGTGENNPSAHDLERAR